MARALRIRTYLAPSLPLGLFEVLARGIGRRVGCRVALESETRWSGPPPGQPDPFAAGDVDLAFCCAPTYLRLQAEPDTAATLMPFAPVFDDPRARRLPVYFSDVLVDRDVPAADLRALRGATWVFNDQCSLSGYWGMLKALRAARLPGNHFGRRLASGSHLASLDAVADGTADVAAVDSNVWRWVRRARPALARRLRRLDAVGPQPVQPIVVRRTLDPRVRGAVAAVLRGAWRDRSLRRALAPFGVEGFAPVTHGWYAAERRALRACEALAA